MPNPFFTEAKFKSLCKSAQHKKVSELIKKLYFNFDLELFKYLKQLEEWLSCSWTEDATQESLSNSFHKHLKETGRGISEHDLLLKDQDREQPIEPDLNAVIYLDHLRSAHNIGNIVRTTEAFRLGKIACSPDMADLNHPAVQKTSMGTYKRVQTSSCSLDELPKPLIAVETHKRAIPLDEYTFPETFTLALGNEEYGVSHAVLDQADVILEIPLVGCKNSLNVAACFSILAWKIRQDRKS